MSPKRPISGHSIIKMAKIKDKEEIWKPSSYTQGCSHKAMDCSAETLQAIGGWHTLSEVVKGESYTKNTLSSKAHVHIRSRNQKLCGEAKAKSCCAPVLQKMLKELLSEERKRPQLER